MLCAVAVFICAITLMRAGSTNLAAIPLSIIMGRSNWNREIPSTQEVIVTTAAPLIGFD